MVDNVERLHRNCLGKVNIEKNESIAERTSTAYQFFIRLRRNSGIAVKVKVLFNLGCY